MGVCKDCGVDYVRVVQPALNLRVVGGGSAKFANTHLSVKIFLIRTRIRNVRVSCDANDGMAACVKSKEGPRSNGMGYRVLLPW